MMRDWLILSSGKYEMHIRTQAWSCNRPTHRVVLLACYKKRCGKIANETPLNKRPYGTEINNFTS